MDINYMRMDACVYRYVPKIRYLYGCQNWPSSIIETDRQTDRQTAVPLPSPPQVPAGAVNAERVSVPQMFSSPPCPPWKAPTNYIQAPYSIVTLDWSFTLCVTSTSRRWSEWIMSPFSPTSLTLSGLDHLPVYTTQPVIRDQTTDHQTAVTRPTALTACPHHPQYKPDGLLCTTESSGF